MATMNCYISAASSITKPMRHDYAPQFSPKMAPGKWSVAVAPDGGVPLETSKLRKYWGGEEEDPLSSDEFIWNKDFMGRFKKMIQDPTSDSSELSPVKEESSGFLNLNRVMNLESLEVDLSKELTAPSKSKPEQLVGSPAQNSGTELPRWRLAPTRREQEKWDRARKAATGGSDVMFREIRQPRGDPNILAAQYREQYFELKKKLQILTLGVGAVGLVSAYVSYSPEIAASFGVGWLGSLIYIRMLGSSIDSMADGAKGLVKGSAMQPRLLIPAVLVMTYNRWNEILVPEYGCMHLELIPMLVGFFTYKIATLVQAMEDSLPLNTKKDQI